MDISINKTNFQSKIKYIDLKQFKNKTKTLNFSRCEVTYPWTVETMKTGQKLFSTGFLDCIYLGATNGIESAMAHLATRESEIAEYEKVKPFDIKNIEQVFSSKFDLFDEDVHCFILGACEANKKYLEQVKCFLEKYKKPYSIFANRKDNYRNGSYSVLFDTPEDTLYISNTLIDKCSKDNMKTFMESQFNEVSLCNLDEWA